MNLSTSHATPFFQPRVSFLTKRKLECFMPQSTKLSMRARVSNMASVSTSEMKCGRTSSRIARHAHIISTRVRDRAGKHFTILRMSSGGRTGLSSSAEGCFHSSLIHAISRDRPSLEAVECNLRNLPNDWHLSFPPAILPKITSWFNWIGTSLSPLLLDAVPGSPVFAPSELVCKGFPSEEDWDAIARLVSVRRLVLRTMVEGEALLRNLPRHFSVFEVYGLVITGLDLSVLQGIGENLVGTGARIILHIIGARTPERTAAAVQELDFWRSSGRWECIVAPWVEDFIRSD
ncbi:hypothetical protein DFJ74DRAFT_694945 [Hyaloraphidium curvatum]|nr:hypothetical protein DFJ74DRAFT_694945 [Hyaloraphidium curvatum]